jgi:hypothetical protein
MPLPQKVTIKNKKATMILNFNQDRRMALPLFEPNIFFKVVSIHSMIVFAPGKGPKTIFILLGTNWHVNGHPYIQFLAIDPLS